MSWNCCCNLPSGATAKRFFLSPGDCELESRWRDWHLWPGAVRVGGMAGKIGGKEGKIRNTVLCSSQKSYAQYWRPFQHTFSIVYSYSSTFSLSDLTIQCRPEDDGFHLVSWKTFFFMLFQKDNSTNFSPGLITQGPNLHMDFCKAASWLRVLLKSTIEIKSKNRFNP